MSETFTEHTHSAGLVRAASDIARLRRGHQTGSLYTCGISGQGCASSTDAQSLKRGIFFKILSATVRTNRANIISVGSRDHRVWTRTSKTSGLTLTEVPSETCHGDGGKSTSWKLVLDTHCEQNLVKNGFIGQKEPHSQ